MIDFTEKYKELYDSVKYYPKKEILESSTVKNGFENSYFNDEKIVINDDNLDDYRLDSIKSKVRAILTVDNKILIANYGGVVMLPGGKIDANETKRDAITRELKEETGIVYSKEELKPLFLLEYYQANYPTRDNRVLNRLMKTYFYYGTFKGIDENNKAMTEKEKKGNFSLELVDIEEFINSLTINENPRSEFFNREIKEAVKVYTKKI